MLGLYDCFNYEGEAEETEREVAEFPESGGGASVAHVPWEAPFDLNSLAGKADRQRLLRIVQQNPSIRVPGHQLVPELVGSKADDRGLAAGIQCKSSSQDSRRQEANGIRQPDRG